MAKKFLGDQIDLHHGGLDLIFPHHENEIAQSEGANKCVFCHTWAHNDFLNFASEKMSKSLGNVVSIRKFSEQYGGFILRHLLVSSHYRSKLDWSDEIIQRSIQESTKIHDFWFDFHEIKSSDLSDSNNANDEELVNKISSCRKLFTEELENDFNSAGALGHFFSFMKDLKGFFDSSAKSKKVYDHMKEFMTFFSNSLNLVNDLEYQSNRERFSVLKSAKKNSLPVEEQSEIEKLILARLEARQKKDFKKSDEIRDQLLKMKVRIKDNSDGSTSWDMD
jgi:cysteinyl-tRNA synthetase